MIHAELTYRLDALFSTEIAQGGVHSNTVWRDGSGICTHSTRSAWIVFPGERGWGEGEGET